MGKLAATLLVILGVIGAVVSLWWLWFITMMQGWSHVRASGDQWFTLAFAAVLIISLAVIVAGVRLLRRRR